MRSVREYFCAQYLAGRVFLTVLDGTLITRWEEEYLLFAHHLTQVVIQISCLVGILHHKQQFGTGLQGKGAEGHRCG